MTREVNWRPVLEQFAIDGDIISVVPYGSGHINDTYCVTTNRKGVQKRYILQRMNDSIFSSPEELMANIVNVIAFLTKKIVAQGGNPERETLNVIPCRNGDYYLKAQDGRSWRVYRFIENATGFDKVEKPEHFYQSAWSFGNFQRLLSDFPAETLYETIPNFHNTPVRLEKFKKAVAADSCQRADAVQAEIDFILAREADTHVLMDMLHKGELPLRVTHNDTKLNNIMIDNETGKGICVIDLDTVMPGLALNDFGDSIRFGASTGDEDEPDLSKVWCNMELFDLYTKGFVEGCAGSLTENELKMLPMGAKLMTLECGMRFLTDYLEGDTYFKIHRDGQNLDRCRTQLKLVKDMEDKWEQMTAIVEKYSH